MQGNIENVLRLKYNGCLKISDIYNDQKIRYISIA